MIHIKVRAFAICQASIGAKLRLEENTSVKYLRHVVAAAAILALPAVSATADSRDRTDDIAVMGYVEDVFVGIRQKVKAGQPMFKLDSSKQEAAVQTAQRKIDEVNAAFGEAKAQLAAAKGDVEQARGSFDQAADELATKVELNKRSPFTVAQREIDRLQRLVQGRQGTLSAAIASKEAVEVKINSLLPAQKATAEAELEQAQVELDKMTVKAGVDGQLEQFPLRKGDIINPLMRPAGVLIPSEAGRQALIAGFDQIQAQIVKVGMVGEATCSGLPLTIIPLVVTEVQQVVSSGQVRPTDVLIDPTQQTRPGSITVFFEPLYEGLFERLPPGSNCIANAYTNNHDRLSEPDVGVGEWLVLHAIDAVGLIHALILRLQALVLPIKTLVFSGH